MDLRAISNCSNCLADWPRSHRKTKNGSQVIRLAGADYHDILAAPGDEAEAVAELIETLQKDRAWKVADFRTLDPDGVLASGFANHFAMRKKLPFKFLFIPHQTYLNVRLPGTWKEMEAQLGKKLAYQMRSAEGKRARTFSSSELRLANAETLDADIDAMVSLHAERAVTKGVSGMFADPLSIDKFRTSAKQLCAAEKLWLFTLWIEAKPVSALFCLVDDRRIYFYNSGFDKTFQKFHPVKVLIAEALRRGIAEHKEEFDFMKGDEPYKTEWANGSRTTMRLVFGRALYGSMYLATLKYAPALSRSCADFQNLRFGKRNPHNTRPY